MSGIWVGKDSKNNLINKVFNRIRALSALFSYLCGCMKRLLPLLLAGLLSACAPQESMQDLSRRVYDLAKVQYTLLDASLPEGTCPRTFQDSVLVTSDKGWWCSGFFPGCLWNVYEATGDPDFLARARKHTLPLETLLNQHTDHDIGFQLMASFGKMYSQTGEGRDVLEKGAAKLAERFVPEAGVIRSWDFGEWNIPVIIDNMMNLSLLTGFGDPEVAGSHAMKTAEHHFRDDGTAWHLVDYADNGAVLGKQTVQGFADSTAWARGQAWALLGFTRMAAFAHAHGYKAWEDTFARTALRLEDWLLENLPEDGVPWWDFSQTDYKDASAAAILACGFLEMAAYRGGDSRALATAERILRTLASPAYLAEPGTNGGFLLKHSVGNKPAGSEVDVPLTYADYYFLEALDRYAKLDL